MRRLYVQFCLPSYCSGLAQQAQLGSLKNRITSKSCNGTQITHMGVRSPQIGDDLAGDQPLACSAFPTLMQPYLPV
jgi:hypothetical protein